MTDLNHAGGPAAEPVDMWWLNPRPAQAGTWAAGICTACPVRSGCGRADDMATVCAVTGNQPPPPPPAYPAGIDLVAEATGYGMQDTVAALLQPGWADIADAVIERSEATHGGDGTDWSRLQVGRNIASLAVAVLLPLGHYTGAGWVAHAVSTGGITAPVFGPAGAVLCAAGSTWLGRHVPGLLGAVCGIGWSLMSAAARGLWSFVRSPRGWLLTRPLIWAAASGVLIVSWRVIVHTLTGA
ncbi:hypothetical protein [Streptomyces sp. NRRL WC-3742]|uniref:hypothetical protein n=1 Tax=Streptomyces sp. NRRL WC-3742 TaxID=1463934 RepID=UPI0004CB064F|nr:hypothetical protein [Streptomyces sp. NRRL WC-3742]